MTTGRVLIIVSVIGIAIGCTSPEGNRTRGGGPGADVGNHPTGPVEIHAGADMYHGTPTNGPAIGEHVLIGGAASAAER